MSIEKKAHSHQAVTKTVKAIGKLNLTNAGYSLIPWPWYEHVTITKKNRHDQEIQYPDLLGVTILSYIVFWYTPTISVDEASQRTNAPRRKFKADKLQCGYRELTSRFGASKEQLRQAIARLNDAGIITVELRVVHTMQGTLSNVMFIEPVPTRIAEISTPSSQLTTTLPLNRRPPSPSIDDHPPLQLKGTYTDASADASTESSGEQRTTAPKNGAETDDVLPGGEITDPPRTKNKDNGKDKKRGELENYFAEISNIPLPPHTTVKQKKDVGQSWWGPLRQILDMTGWDLKQAKGLVRESYKILKNPEKNFNVSSPKSIIKTAISLHADKRIDPNGTRRIQV